MVGTESWRDFIAEAPNFRLEIYSGIPFYLDLQQLLIQGAVSFEGESPIPDLSTHIGDDGQPLGDPLLYTVEELPLRGWNYIPITIMDPVNAIVRNTRDRRGWVITAAPGYEGEDCFNYFLTNGFQASGYGKVELIILPWYELLVEIQYNPDTGQYRFEADIKVPSGAEVPTFQSYRWTFLGPNDYDGDNLVSFDETGVFMSTFYKIETFGTWRRSYDKAVVYRTGKDTGWITVPSDTDVDGMKDPMTGLPYSANGTLLDIVIEVDLYLDGTSTLPNFSPTGRTYTIRKKLSDLLGMSDWSKSGLIDNLSKPTVDEASGNVSPPYAIETEARTHSVDDPYVPDVDSPV